MVFIVISPFQAQKNRPNGAVLVETKRPPEGGGLGLNIQIFRRERKKMAGSPAIYRVSSSEVSRNLLQELLVATAAASTASATTGTRTTAATQHLLELLHELLKHLHDFLRAALLIALFSAAALFGTAAFFSAATFFAAAALAAALSAAALLAAFGLAELAHHIRELAGFSARTAAATACATGAAATAYTLRATATHGSELLLASLPACLWARCNGDACDEAGKLAKNTPTYAQYGAPCVFYLKFECLKAP